MSNSPREGTTVLSRSVLCCWTPCVDTGNTNDLRITCSRAPEAAQGREWPPISDKTVYHACVTAARRAVSRSESRPHLLRHCFATHHWKAARTSEKIQRLLGHGDLEDHRRYLHLSQRHLQAL